MDKWTKFFFAVKKMKLITIIWKVVKSTAVSGFGTATWLDRGSKPEIFYASLDWIQKQFWMFWAKSGKVKIAPTTELSNFPSQKILSEHTKNHFKEEKNFEQKISKELLCEDFEPVGLKYFRVKNRQNYIKWNFLHFRPINISMKGIKTEFVL